jgi:hypothetical protein
MHWISVESIPLEKRRPALAVYISQLRSQLRDPTLSSWMRERLRQRLATAEERFR